MNEEISQREFVRSSTAGIFVERKACQPLMTRGINLYQEDIGTVAQWPQTAKDAGLTTIAIHPGGGHKGNTVQNCIDFIQSDKGQQFLKDCERLGLEVEYELHAMKELLPRSLFEKHPEMFRMDKKGKRQRSDNLCVHSEKALEVVCANAIKIGNILKPTTGRYFYWIDDARDMCRCDKCHEYSDSEQALILENRILKALRTIDKNTTLAHLAYANTIMPPEKIKPDAGIFLEFAPIHRQLDKSLKDQKGSDSLQTLKENLAVFPVETAQVLEYWLDVSMASKWKRPFVKLPWYPKVFTADVATYSSLGIKHITSFGCGIDKYYYDTHGEPPIKEYGNGLLLIGNKE